MITLSEVAALGSAIGLIGGAIAYVRSNQLKGTLDVLSRGNDELRKVVADLELARARDQARCDSQLGELRGRVAVLTQDLARDIARAIAHEWRSNPPGGTA